MRPLDFYDLGVRLHDSSATEAEHRTVVNRIYYGLHHEVCCRYFRQNRYAQPLNRNRRHTDLRNRLNDALDPSSGEVAQLLRSLMDMRSEADYELSTTLRHRGRSLSPQQLAERAIRVGRELLDALEAYVAGESGDGCECPQTYSVG